MTKARYKHFPTGEMIETAGLQQLTMWLNWLPVPFTKAEEFIYNKIVEKRDSFLPSNLTSKELNT